VKLGLVKLYQERIGEGYYLYLCVVHHMNHSWSLSPESGGGLLQASGPTQHKLSVSK